MPSHPVAGSKAREQRAGLERCLAQLRTNVLFVEGQRDRHALQRLGCASAYTISGNLVISCAQAAERGVQKAVILTDLDRRGNELARRAVEELERYGIQADTDCRKRLGRLLRLKYFEDIDRLYRAFIEEYNEKQA